LELCRAQELAGDLRSSAAEVCPVRCDLTDESDVLKAFEWIETTVGQGVSVMINNAGTLTKTQLLSTCDTRDVICLFWARVDGISAREDGNDSPARGDVATCMLAGEHTDVTVQGFGI